MSEVDNEPNEEKSRREYSFSRFYSGPLPTEDVLAGYERILPGSADRVFSMVERQQRFQFILQILKSSVNLFGLSLIVGLAAFFILQGAPELVVAIGAATPTVIAITGGIVTVWRNAQKTLMDKERHKHTLRLEAEQHDLDIQIRKEQHELDMQIKRERHLRALESGDERLALPDTTEKEDGVVPIDDEDEDDEMKSSA